MAAIPLIVTLTLILIVTAGGDRIHDLLKSHGLPAGLLPNSVASFSFDPSTGLLEVNLDRPCFARFDGLVHFDRTIRGNLSHGEIGGVVGLKQEELFVWLPVKGISVSDPRSGVILFDIGLAKKQLSLSLFEVPPQCLPATDLKGTFGSKGMMNQLLETYYIYVYI